MSALPVPRLFVTVTQTRSYCRHCNAAQRLGGQFYADVQGDLKGLFCADCVVVTLDSSGDELREVLDGSVRSGGGRSTRPPNNRGTLTRKEGRPQLAAKGGAPAAQRR